MSKETKSKGAASPFGKGGGTKPPIQKIEAMIPAAAKPKTTQKAPAMSSRDTGALNVPSGMPDENKLPANDQYGVGKGNYTVF